MSRKKKFKLGKRHARCYVELLTASGGDIEVFAHVYGKTKTQATQRAAAVTEAVNARKWYLGKAIRGAVQFTHDALVIHYGRTKSPISRFLAGLSGAFLRGGEVKQ